MTHRDTPTLPLANWLMTLPVGRLIALTEAVLQDVPLREFAVACHKAGVEPPAITFEIADRKHRPVTRDEGEPDNQS